MKTTKALGERSEANPPKGENDVPSNVGRRDQAKRWAVNHFEEWHDVTNIPPKHSGYYYEIISLIEDAADIGFGVAHDETLEQIKKNLQ